MNYITWIWIAFTFLFAIWLLPATISALSKGKPVSYVENNSITQLIADHTGIPRGMIWYFKVAGLVFFSSMLYFYPTGV